MRRKKNQDWSKLLIIGAIVTALLVIFSVVLFTVFGEKEKKVSGKVPEPTVAVDEDREPYDPFVLAVYLETDTSRNKLKVRQADTGEILWLDYHGGTKIRDKYDQDLSVSQLVSGQMVELYFNQGTKDLGTLKISNQIWEAIGVTDVVVNKETRMLTFHGTNYTFPEHVTVLYQGQPADIGDVLDMDYVTLRGVEENVYVVQINQGHGYLELSGEEDFIDGTISVGTVAISRITEDLRLTVKEGTYPVTVRNKDMEGTKEVTIIRGQTLRCNIEEFGMAAIQRGRVRFAISPEGASLSIDGVKTKYQEAVELTYGEHEIEVSLGGYVTYQGKLTVDKTDQTVSITLPETDGTTGGNSNNNNSNNGNNNNNNGNNNGNSGSNDGTNTDGESDDENGFDDNWNDTSGDTEIEDSTSDEDDDSTGSGNDADSNSGNSGSNTGSGGSTSGGNSGNQSSNKDKTITIHWKSGADVYFDGSFMGTIKNGKLVVEKQIGTIDVDLVIEGEESKTYQIEVEDDGADASFSFPK